MNHSFQPSLYLLPFFGKVENSVSHSPAHDKLDLQQNSYKDCSDKKVLQPTNQPSNTGIARYNGKPESRSDTPITHNVLLSN